MPWFEGPRCCLSLGPVWMAKPILENLAKPAIFWRTGSIGFLKFSQISTWVHNISTCPSTLNPLHSSPMHKGWKPSGLRSVRKKRGSRPRRICSSALVYFEMVSPNPWLFYIFAQILIPLLLLLLFAIFCAFDLSEK